MADVYCPLYGDAYYSYDIDLEDEAYTLTFRWNSRMELYVMDIEDAEEDVVIQGVVLVPMFPLIGQYVVEGLTGDFFLVPVDTTDPYQPIPDPRNTYKSHYLVYSTLD